jgi:uncharacterized protein (UPF0548 family)
VTVRLLSAREADALRAEALTYGEIGATADARPVVGYHRLEESRVLQRRDFDGAVETLMTWQVHRRAGLRVAASSATVAFDGVVLMRLGVGSLALRIPCRIVYVVDEPTVKGFAYGTLPGHPESGEERFVLTRRDDGSVEFTITAFSRPQTRLARVGGPVGRWVQRVMTRRYLAALDR